ncbi:hypothetical protein OEZ85_009837 [Tetradesmus obliquus]|uniref:Uncharacterized protein n=1 Tax=Tetradesmus obliquus TaxID=3088 RepID=A0ABY8UAP0_TETOB|nr:hypothetical protein OEZ85_009837 [Tetradesmus obliquus]
MSTASSDPRIARKTGEGYDKPNADQELPIDINYQKLPEWLVSRQKLPADWHKRLEAIKSKISEAEKELPPGLLSQLPGPADAPVDYFRALQIRDKLAESGERTLFGGLSGQAGIWDKIVKAYENGGVFVGEAAQTMIQNVDYEIPYLRKQMAKCNQQMADADRRHAEYSRSAVTCANNYKKECEKLGISGAGPAGLSGSSSSSDLLRALAPDVVASTDAGDVGHMLACVEALLAALNDEKLRQLLMISSSSRYMERLQGSLQRKAGQEARMLAAAAETQARKQESRATLVGLQPKLAEIVAETRSVKKAVEASLAKQFAGRRVNVLGEINNALTAAS